VTSDASVTAVARPVTLELEGALFRRAGAALGAPLSLRSQARRIGLIGAWEPLFLALGGEASVSRGNARIFGCEIESALARGVVGFAPCDPPLPASFSVREYLEHAARLSHGSRARARDDARRTLEELGLGELTQLQLGCLLPHQARALGIAFAALTTPAVLCLETPLRGLDAASADYVARLCAHVAERSSVILSSALPQSPSAERALLETCDELFRLEHGALVAQGSPQAVFAPGARYLLTLAGSQHAELAAALTSAGCQLTPEPAPTAFSGLLAADHIVTRYLVELPEAANPDLLLDSALAVRVTVLELEPLLGAG
jgi:ABC-type Na+ transport system ATPase subunit NatA